MADVVKWTFYDPAGPTTYTFPINPSEGGSPPYKKNLTYQNTAAPDGKTLIFQGRPEAQELEFTGVILEQVQYDAFVTWWNKQNQIRITDDLARQYWVVIKDFEPKRVRAFHHPWKHSYTCRATIVNWP